MNVCVADDVVVVQKNRDRAVEGNDNNIRKIFWKIGAMSMTKKNIIVKRK